ncbi:MAG: stalk domain-containing protein, partial [Tumebacillaceae bacterium]
MKKTCSTVLFGAMVLIGFDASAHAAVGTKALEQPAIQVFIDGKQQTYEQPPVMQNDRTLVPMRGIFETLGAQVLWNEAQNSVAALKGNTRVFLQLGQRLVEKNGLPQLLDVAPQMINDRTMVPMRFVSEALGADVKWDGPNNRVLITTQPQVGTVSTNTLSSQFPYPINTSYITNDNNRSFHMRTETRFLVLHETVSKADARRQLSFFNNNNADANAHVFVDWNEVLQTVPVNEIGWAVGKPANNFTFHMEMCHARTKEEFQKSWEIATLYVAQWCSALNRDPNTFIRTHHEIATTYGGTDHTDPDGYFAEYGKTVNDFRHDVATKLKAIEASK